MPCDSSYMEASHKEVALSRVACLLDELDGKEINRTHWDGYHPDIYNKVITNQKANRLVSTLCSKLQQVDVTKYSLEMQMWWRDHQRADKARVKDLIDEKKKEAERKKAVAKLSPYERKLLGL